MSIFGFLEEIFFCRTENSESTKTKCRGTENSKEKIIKNRKKNIKK
jgi:hypothetical protein